jgi:hypothetical protein
MVSSSGWNSASGFAIVQNMSCWKKPGPAAGPFQARLGDGSVVTYYWYRFADQPAMLNADLTPEEREVLQKRVEMLHRVWTKDRNYLAPSYPVNPGEYPVRQTDRNYSYFIPVTWDMLGKACEVVVLGFDSKNIEFKPDVWLTAYPVPYQVKTLTLSE